MKSFILMTTGRAGSTALMDSLEKFEDIAVPNKQIECRDNEILHPGYVKQYALIYQKITGLNVQNERDLINAFYNSNKHFDYAGFKSMPNRHPHFLELISNKKIQIITLHRSDIASTVASFIIASDANTWRREGGDQPNNFTFGADYEKRAFSHLLYIEQSWQRLKIIPNAIHLTYEDLCSDDFNNVQLDEYFQRNIKLMSPKKPTLAEHYVDNWQEFSTFIDIQFKKIMSKKA